MTKKKRRQLEAARLEEERRAEEAAKKQSQPAYFPGITFGSMSGMVLPVSDGQLNAVQLPPIIQPISIVPMMQETKVPAAKDDFDDFDDFDDWD